MTDIWNPDLDQLDLMIIREMERDARQGHVAIAKKLNTTSTTVYRRVKRLLEKHLVTVNLVPNPFVLGFKTRVVFGINTRLGAADVVADRLASIQSIRHILITTGRYNIQAWTTLISPGYLPNFVVEELGSISDIVRIETLLIIRVIKSNWAYLGDEDTPSMRGHIATGVDEWDLALIKELEIDPRRTITKLAQTVGIHRSAVSRRLQRLVDENIVRFVATADMSALGYHIATAIMIKVHPGMILEVSRAIASCRNVPQLVMTAGSFDLIALAMFRNLAEMHSFLINQLGSIPGIVSYETADSLKLVKSTWALLSDSNKLPSTIMADDIPETDYQNAK